MHLPQRPTLAAAAPAARASAPAPATGSAHSTAWPARQGRCSTWARARARARGSSPTSPAPGSTHAARWEPHTCVASAAHRIAWLLARPRERCTSSMNAAREMAPARARPSPAPSRHVSPAPWPTAPLARGPHASIHPAVLLLLLLPAASAPALLSMTAAAPVSIRSSAGHSPGGSGDLPMWKPQAQRSHQAAHGGHAAHTQGGSHAAHAQGGSPQLHSKQQTAEGDRRQTGGAGGVLA